MRHLKYILVAVCVLLLTSCSDFLEEYSQDTYYVKTWSDLDELLIGECYMQTNNSVDVNNKEREPGFFLPYVCDEVEEQTKSYTSYYASYDLMDAVFGYYTWQQRVGQNDAYTGFNTETDTWTPVYKLINVANNILESAQDVPQSTDTDKEGVLRVTGEAYFLRGLYYFWLANIYGKPYDPSTADTDLAVPLKTEAKVNDKVYQRNTVTEVYDQVLSDLLKAEELLSQTTKKKTIYRADSTAVQLLLSRVYLYMQNWDKSIEYADKVLKVRSTLTNINGRKMGDGFLSADSKETLFSMSGTDIPRSMMNYAQSFRVAHELYDTYDDTDLRKSQWFWVRDEFIGYTKVQEGQAYEESARNPENDNYYFYAYYYGYSGKSPVSDRFLFRTAEAYLNKAEAEAYLGNEDEAHAAVNKVRLNRYETGSNYEITATGEALVKAIRDERRRELAFEGHRWFDLRRYMVCEKYPYSKSITHNYTYYTGRGETDMVTTHVFTLKENDPAYTLPIPQSVIEYNTGMVQNERYWRDYETIDPNI